MSAPALWRSELLGETRRLKVPGGEIECFIRGQGSAIVFCHGWLANANLWREVVARLATRFTCLTLDLPLGSHRLAMTNEADLSPTGCGALIVATIEQLGLDDVTLVGNDSGGAYGQIALASHSGLAARLVLNSCETPYDEFPPPPFDGLPAAAREPLILGRLLAALRNPEVRLQNLAYGLLIKHPVEEQASDSYVLPCLETDGVLGDVAKVMSSASSPPIHAAGAKLIESFDGPVLLAWSPEDRVFALENAKRYAEALHDGRLELIEDAYSFTPEDQPVALAKAIARFAGA